MSSCDNTYVVHMCTLDRAAPAFVCVILYLVRVAITALQTPVAVHGSRSKTTVAMPTGNAITPRLGPKPQIQTIRPLEDIRRDSAHLPFVRAPHLVQVGKCTVTAAQAPGSGWNHASRSKTAVALHFGNIVTPRLGPKSKIRITGSLEDIRGDRFPRLLLRGSPPPSR